MSKPITRVAFFVLVSLLLIAATSASVRGWLGGTRDVASVQSHVVSGLQTNLNHDRSTVSELQTLQLQMDSQSLQPSGKGHGCESERQNVPLD
jgi:hypothetical protein